MHATENSIDRKDSSRLCVCLVARRNSDCN